LEPSQISEEKTHESHLNALSSIGLSQYEARCYLASLQLGPTTINQIGQIAQVPRTKVYGAIRKLVERGLEEQSEDDPKIYSARSPREVLVPLLEKEEKRVKSDLEALTELEVIHQSIALVKRADTLRSKVLRYYPRIAITRKIRDLFQLARKKVLILTTANGLIRLSKMADILYERSRFGLTVEIFSSTRDEPVFTTAVQSLKEIENSTISYLPSAPTTQIIIIDAQYFLACELKPDDLRDEGMDVGFLIQSSELSEMMESMVRVMTAVQRELPRGMEEVSKSHPAVSS
jgi:HTH-type transcriptional regulator, sugar sensing transcriptional regulator